jgi:hypothetical protein
LLIQTAIKRTKSRFMACIFIKIKVLVVRASPRVSQSRCGGFPQPIRFSKIPNFMPPTFRLFNLTKTSPECPFVQRTAKRIFLQVVVRGLVSSDG